MGVTPRPGMVGTWGMGNLSEGGSMYEADRLANMTRRWLESERGFLLSDVEHARTIDEYRAAVADLNRVNAELDRREGRV